MGNYYGRSSYGEWYRAAKRAGRPRKAKKYVPVKPSGKAPILTEEQFDAAERMALERSIYPLRDRLFVLFSRYCGMRAKEIATVWVNDITDVEGRLKNEIEISGRGAKYGKSRIVYMHPELIAALRDYIEITGITDGPLFWSHRGVPMTSNAVQKRFKVIYRACGLEGARSHSGRRTVITMLARHINTIDATFEDIRMFAGHAHVETTMEYVEPLPDTHIRLMTLIPGANRGRRQ